MDLIYNIKDKPRFGQVVLFAIQQLLAIMAATIAVPAVINNACGTEMTASAALFGAGVGTLVVICSLPRCSSPVFLGSVVCLYRADARQPLPVRHLHGSAGYRGADSRRGYGGTVVYVLSLHMIVKIVGRGVDQ